MCIGLISKVIRGVCQFPAYVFPQPNVSVLGRTGKRGHDRL